MGTILPPPLLPQCKVQRPIQFSVCLFYSGVQTNRFELKTSCRHPIPDYVYFQNYSPFEPRWCVFLGWLEAESVIWIQRGMLLLPVEWGRRWANNNNDPPIVTDDNDKWKIWGLHAILCSLSGWNGAKLRLAERMPNLNWIVTKVKLWMCHNLFSIFILFSYASRSVIKSHFQTSIASRLASLFGRESWSPKNYIITYFW